MKTLHRFLVGLVVVALFATACGTATPVAAPTTTAPTVAAPTSAPEASGNISFMVFGDPAELKAYQTVVTAFEQKYPQIKVEVIHLPSQGDYSNRLAADLAAGTPADIVLLNYRRYAGFVSKKALAPLDSYINASTLLKPSDFYPQSFNAFSFQKSVYCLPQNISSLEVYYNKALFDAAGVAYPAADWTWDDFLNTAKALTKDTNSDGQTDEYGLGTEVTLIRVAPFIWQNGGDVVNRSPEGNPSQLAWDTPETKTAIQWFVDWQVKHHIVPTQEEEKSESSQNRFLNGRLGMYLDSRRVVPTFRESIKFDWDVAPLPRGTVAKATILHSDGYCMTSASKNKEAAWKLMEFANSPEGQTIIAGTGRTVPSLKAVASSPAYLDPKAKPANSKVWIDMADYVVSVPVLPAWADVEEIAGAELQQAYYGQKSVDDAVKTAIEQTRKYFTETE